MTLNETLDRRASTLASAWTSLFGELSEAARADIARRVEFVRIEGGSFDNLPVDVARELGTGRVIASNLASGRNYELKYDAVPSTWQLLRDRYITRRRRYKVPGMVNTMFRATVLSSQDRSKEAGARADLYLESPMEKVGLLNWAAFDHAMETGYRYARERLQTENLSPESWLGNDG